MELADVELAVVVVVPGDGVPAVAVGLLDVAPLPVWLAVEVPAFELLDEPEFVLLANDDVEELLVNGLAEPEPQPTTEAIATAAAPNFTNTLGEKCTLKPRNLEFVTN